MPEVVDRFFSAQRFSKFRSIKVVIRWRQFDYFSDLPLFAVLKLNVKWFL